MGFQQALSGLNAASKSLDVIGHNIANSGTTGFKASRAEFSESMASAVGAASGQSTGIGVNVAAVTQIFTQGPITSTGNHLDVAINGDGFFVVRAPGPADERAYTRAGNFHVDKQGYLVTVNGDQVLGRKIEPATGTPLAGEVPMVFPSGKPIEAKATSKIAVELNLDARALKAAGDPAATPPVPETPRSTYGTSLNVYDSQGVSTQVSVYFEKTDANEWKVYDGLDDPSAVPPKVANLLTTLKFDASGKLVSGSPVLNAKLSASNPNSPDPEFINGADGVELDFSSLTQFGSKFAVGNLTQDGYESGSLVGISVGGDGSILASYSNGVARTEGQLVLATFRNPQGLAAGGNNKWVETAESGLAVNDFPKSGTRGTLQASALEDSNVDLTAELVDMMTAQRAYQSNAQAIKTQDQVFSTLVNLR